MQRFEKLRTALRYWLQGAADHEPSYVVAIRAFDFAMERHVGTRKDGVTPEFMHQLETAQFVRTLRGSLLYPAETIATMLLHDVHEDYGAPFAQLRDLFGPRVERAVRQLSKVREGVRISNEQYFGEMDCPIATVCKGSDRVNNQQSMLGVFTAAKQLQYIAETEQFILPMLKRSRRQHPEQEGAYENLKWVLRSQIQLLKAVNNVT